MGQKGLIGFSSSLKQGDCGSGQGHLSQICGSYCNMDELNKRSSSIPCNSASGQAGLGVIGGVGLEQTNEVAAGILPGGPAAIGSTTSLAGGPLLPSGKLIKGEYKFTSTTMMTEEDSLTDVAEEVYRVHQSRQSEHHLPQCAIPSCGILRSSTSSRFYGPIDSLSLATGEAYGGRQSNRLTKEHFPLLDNNVAAAARGALSITAASNLGKSADSLSSLAAAGELLNVKKRK